MVQEAFVRQSDLFSDGDGNGLIYGAASSAGHDGETTKDSQQQQPGTVGNPSVSPPGITSVAVHHQTNTNLVTFSGGHTTTTTTGLTEEEILKRLESEALSNGTKLNSDTLLMPLV